MTNPGFGSGPLPHSAGYEMGDGHHHQQHHQQHDHQHHQHPHDQHHQHPHHQHHQGGGRGGDDNNSATVSPVHQNDMFMCALKSRCAYGDPTYKEPGMRKLEYKGFFWHEQCFRCMACNAPIGQGVFIPRGQEIFCPACYDETFSSRCRKCSRVIVGYGVMYNNDPWHRECFTCCACHKMLSEERFTSKNGKPYCAACYGAFFARRCRACGGAITGLNGVKYCTFDNNNWHHECFKCSACKTPLIASGFVFHGDYILCPQCDQDRRRLGPDSAPAASMLCG